MPLTLIEAILTVLSSLLLAFFVGNSFLAVKFFLDVNMITVIPLTGLKRTCLVLPFVLGGKPFFSVCMYCRGIQSSSFVLLELWASLKKGGDPSCREVIAFAVCSICCRGAGCKICPLTCSHLDPLKGPTSLCQRVLCSKSAQGRSRCVCYVSCALLLLAPKSSTKLFVRHFAKCISTGRQLV